MRTRTFKFASFAARAVLFLGWLVPVLMAETAPPTNAVDETELTGALFDNAQMAERTCFQTGAPWSPQGDLRSDVAIAYGIDKSLPSRIDTWRAHGYRIHVMTGVAWGEYQDYVFGRFDGINHEDEAQTDRNGNKIGHGRDVYYMCPGTNYGKFLCVGVQRALDAGAEAIHLEEPEFWDRAGYSDGFKREWKNYYHDDWQPPHSSVDARWRTGKLKYSLYRRALQQVFDYVHAYNQKTGRRVRCYVPTHSLLNYALWCIVSPESSLARVNGCDGYIAQVWTGTARSPVVYRGGVHSRTFETAFLEYGAMQNLVRATGRTVWYLNDPIEDNPDHDWQDYKVNWESTLTASLFQPEVSKYEVAPWPERIFNGRYPRNAAPENRKPIPPEYATELQVVLNQLNNMNQPQVTWDCGTTGVGVLVSDSLMFQRGEPTPSDPWLGNFYGVAMPLVKCGLPVAPVQLENVTISNALQDYKILYLTYDGQKPLSPEVHAPIADWVRAGGVLVFCDADADPYLGVHEWWNSGENHFATPRQHLFAQLNVDDSLSASEFHRVGKGGLIWLKERPAEFSKTIEGADQVVASAKLASQNAGLDWTEKNYMVLRRGPYVVAAGLDESISQQPHQLNGNFVSLFDPQLRVQTNFTVTPGSRHFLIDLDLARTGQTHLLAAACGASLKKQTPDELDFTVEGVGKTPAIVLMEASRKPAAITLAGEDLADFKYAPEEHLLWIHFENRSSPRELSVRFGNETEYGHR